jgi:uncharacterized membrane protein
VNWYEKKERDNKSKFHLFQAIIIIASGLIPILYIVDFVPIHIRVISSILGGTISAMTALIQMKKYHENW